MHATRCAGKQPSLSLDTLEKRSAYLARDPLQAVPSPECLSTVLVLQRSAKLRKLDVDRTWCRRQVWQYGWLGVITEESLVTETEVADKLGTLTHMSVMLEKA